MDEDRGSLFGDIARESWQSLVAMPRWASALLAIGLAGFLTMQFVSDPLHPPIALAPLRLLFFIMFVIGLIQNARTLDEFYMQVYLHACAISLMLSMLAIYGAYVFGHELGIFTLPVTSVTFGIGFVLAFAYLRRA